MPLGTQQMPPPRGTDPLALVRETAFKNSFLLYLDCVGSIPGETGKVFPGNGSFLSTVKELQTHSVKLNFKQISSQSPSAS